MKCRTGELANWRTGELSNWRTVELANNSSRRTIVHPIQNMLCGELKFAIGERSSRRTSSRRTLVRGGWFSSRERIFWRTVRQFAAEYGRTRANPGELRRTPANVRRTPANVRRSSAECRCWRTDGEFARSSREFARVRPSSREFAANDSSPGILPREEIQRSKYTSFIHWCDKDNIILFLLIKLETSILSTGYEFKQPQVHVS